MCDKQLSKVDVYNAIIRAYPFRDFSTDDFDSLLTFLVEVKQIRLQDDLISQGARSRIYFHGNRCDAKSTGCLVASLPPALVQRLLSPEP